MKVILAILIVCLSIIILVRIIDAGRILNTEPFVETIHDEKGNLLLQDTPRMWNDWTEIIDYSVAFEVAGNHAPGGKSTWNEYWVSLIETNKTGRENPERYIEYIIKRRQSAGLPPLEGLTQ